MPKRKLQSQPRIPGIRRIQKSEGLLPVVEHGLEQIARMEKRSVSWVKAEIICAYFGLDTATGKPISEAEKRIRTRGGKVTV